jgi:hypothetical protein
MALHRMAQLPRAAAFPDLVRPLLIIAAVIVLMVVLTALLGWHQLGPSYQIVPDPAGPAGLRF